MKKLFLSLCIAILPLSFSHAQGGTTYFGLKGGISLSGYSGADWDAATSGVGTESSDRFSFCGALAVNSYLGQWFLLKHEFWAVNKGSNIEYLLGNKIAYSRWYMDLAPIQFGVNLKGFEVFAGPQAGLLLFKNDISTDILGNETKDDNQDGLSILDYGYIMGAEYEFPFGLNLGVRYIKGFRGLDEDNTQEWYNSSLLITAGYTFGKDD